MVTEETRQKYKKTIDEFCLMDDTFMSVVFGKDIKLAEMLLQIILEDDKIKVIECSNQYVIKNLQGHSSTLDIFCIDGNGEYFNVEVQRTNSGAVPQRARYHASLVDTKHFPAGEDYVAIKDSYIIFITERDVLGGDLPCYHIDRRIRETGTAFGDGSFIIYVNASKKNDDTPLSNLMHDFFCKNPNDIKNKALAAKVRHFKEDETGVDEMCELMQKLANEAAEQAAKKAKHDNSVEIAERLLYRGTSIDDIAYSTALPRDEVEAIAERLGKKTA